MRSILEDILLSTMYELPDLKGVSKVVINKEVINHKEEPVYVYEEISPHKEQTA